MNKSKIVAITVVVSLFAGLYVYKNEINTSPVNLTAITVRANPEAKDSVETISRGGKMQKVKASVSLDSLPSVLSNPSEFFKKVDGREVKITKKINTFKLKEAGWDEKAIKTFCEVVKSEKVKEGVVLKKCDVDTEEMKKIAKDEYQMRLFTRDEAEDQEIL